MLYPEGSVLTAGRPRSCTPRDRFCGPYNIAIAIIVGAVPLGIGADVDRLCRPYNIAIATIVGAVPLGIGAESSSPLAPSILLSSLLS